MTDIPIIFSAPMVVALLDGRKTMTRRLAWRLHDVNDNHVRSPSPWQRVKPGDRLWVREAHWRWGRWSRECPNKDEPFEWRFIPMGPSRDQVKFDKPAGNTYERRANNVVGWWLRPSIFLPREFSRLTLVVTATKIEPVQVISREDAIAEGLNLVSQEIEQFFRWPEPFDAGLWLSPPAAFEWLWNQLHGAESWDANPEVVPLTFAVRQQNIDAMGRAA